MEPNKELIKDLLSTGKSVDFVDTTDFDLSVFDEQLTEDAEEPANKTTDAETAERLLTIENEEEFKQLCTNLDKLLSKHTEKYDMTDALINEYDIESVAKEDQFTDGLFADLDKKHI